VLSLNGNIIVFGGTYRDSNGVAVTQAKSEVIDLDTETVYPLNVDIAPALESASCGDNNVNYFIGGLDNTPASIKTITKYDAALEKYTTVGELTISRASASCAVKNNKIYVFGGYTQNAGNDTILDSVEIYDLIANTSTEAAALPHPLYNASAIHLVDKVYVVGGRDSSNVLSTIYEYNIEQNNWTALIDMPSPRYQTRSATINGNIIILGGHDDTANASTPNKDILELNVTAKTWETIGRVLSDKAGYSIAVDKGQIYFIGGDSGNTVARFDYFSKTWFPKSSMSTQASQAAATQHGNDVYLVGGQGRTDPSASNATLASVEKYEPSTDSWTFVENAPVARAGASAVSYKKNIFVIGGMESGQATTRVDIYDSDTNTWQQRADAVLATSNAIAYAVDDKIYVLGGDASQRSVQEYDINGDTWAIKKNTLIGRKNAATVLYEGYIYILGGITVGELSDNSKIRNTAYRYNTKGDFWETLPSLNSARSAASAFVLNGRIFVAGGKNDMEFLSTVEIFNPHQESGRWALGPSLHTARAGAFGAAVDGIGYLVGGETNAQTINQDIETLE
jgi:N-acetylneuraminic acid mutarotase